MIGVAIGVIFSVVIFTIYNKDTRAVNQFKKKKQQQKQKKQKLVQQEKQKLEKLKNDPLIIKRNQESQKRIKQKLFEGISEEDRKLLQQYMNEQKKSGKSEQQIIKDATAKAGLFMVVMMLIVFAMVFAFIIITTDADLNNFGKQIQRLLSGVYPKFASQSSQVGQTISAGQSQL